MIHFKDKCKHKECGKDLTVGSIYMTEKGSMTSITFIQWVQQSPQLRAHGKILLILFTVPSHTLVLLLSMLPKKLNHPFLDSQ